MILAMHQPYFMPYLGYFSLIKHADLFILSDLPQSIRHGWIERNRICKPIPGWQYVQIPLKKHPHTISIKYLTIDNSKNWKEKIFGQLDHYRKKAPYYKEAMKVVSQALDIQTDNLVILIKHSLKAVCDYLGIEPNMHIFSEMNLTEFKSPSSADEWGLNAALAVGNIKEYWNLYGGLELYDRRKYLENGIEIKFLKVKIEPYAQKTDLFEPSLSIIDVMMFNSAETINKMLDNYELI